MTAQEAAYRQQGMGQNRQGPTDDALYWKWRRVLEDLGELPLSPIERQVLEQTLAAVLTRRLER